MRLGLILFTMPRPARLPYRYRGKHRIVKQPTMKQLQTMREDFDREEQNMLLLRHPYLTVEQEHGHMKHLNTSRQLVEKFKEVPRMKFYKRITFAEQLVHLRVTEAWD